MEWQPLASDLDVQNLLQIFGGFHDSCVTEVFMRTRESVDEKLSMGFNNSPIVRMTFQRQFRNPISIEIQFDGVEDFNWVNASFSTDTGMTVITDGVLLFKDGLLYWAAVLGR